MADGSSGKVPPNDLDAEAAVLSAILRDRSLLDEVRTVVAPSDFYADANRRIYEAALELDSEGKPYDIVLVAGRLRDAGRLQEIGGSPYLAQLSDATPATANVVEHAKVIVEKARVRNVIAACQRYAAEGYVDVGDPREWALNAAQALADIAASGEEEDPAELFSELIPRELKAIRDRAAREIHIAGIPTKLEVYDRMISGYAEGKFHVLGGRPGMGKTSFAFHVAMKIAEQGLGVVFISAEMDKEELARKAMSIEGRVDFHKVRSGRMLREDWGNLADAAARLKPLPMSLKHRPGATVGLIRGTVRKEFRRLREKCGVEKLGLIVVDYLQLLDGERKQGESREQEVSTLSRRLTWMAAEFGAPVLALSQLNRTVESRNNKDKRPTLADLRESGAIEQDAYTVTMLYRDEYYNPGSEDRGTLELLVRKNRCGATGKCFVKFTAEYGRIDNLAADYEGSGGDDQE